MTMAALEGYRELGKRDFVFSKFALFGLLRHQKILLKRRPVRRFFALTGRSAKFLDVSFLTDAAEIAHGVVDISIRYLGPGRSVRRSQTFQLFADPVGKVKPQRLWLNPPKGAVFAEISFSRARPGQAVALDGRLMLRKQAHKPGLDHFEEILASRDLSAMELVLEQLEDCGDDVRARQLLVKMRGLCQDERILRRLTSLDDARHILKFGPNFRVPVGKPVMNGKKTLTFTETGLSEALQRVPMKKALRTEALRVHRSLQSMGSRVIEVPMGQEMLGRLLVAATIKNSCPDVSVLVDWPGFESAPQQLGPWLRFADGASFLETAGGQVLQSALRSS